MQFSFSRRARENEAPIELRFVDLFMILVTVLIFVSVLLSVISAVVGGSSSVTSPTIRTQSLPSGRQGEYYEVALSASEGTGIYKWSASNVPEGVALGTDGILAGVPTDSTASKIVISVRDSKGQSASRTLEMRVLPPTAHVDAVASGKPTLRDAAWLLGDAVKGEAYSAALKSDSPARVARWRLISGVLPADLGWNAEGNISGTANAEPGSYRFRMAADDPAGKRILEGDVAIVVKAKPVPRWWSRLSLAMTILFWTGMAWSYWRGFSFEGVSNIIRRRRDRYTDE